MKRKGFTLVELLIVIAILGTLAAMMTLSSTGATTSARATAIVTGLRTAKTAAALFHSDYPDTDFDDATNGFIEKKAEYFDEAAMSDATYYHAYVSKDNTALEPEWFIGYEIQQSEMNVKSRLAGLAGKNKLYGGKKDGSDYKIDNTGTGGAPKEYAATGDNSALVYMKVR